jgi:hypothetical protein
MVKTAMIENIPTVMLSNDKKDRSLLPDNEEYAKIKLSDMMRRINLMNDFQSDKNTFLSSI